MDNQISLEKAIESLREEYGESYTAGYDDGKHDMARTLEHKLHISGKDAKAVIEALIEARTIRWTSKAEGVANPATTAGMMVEEATWYL